MTSYFIPVRVKLVWLWPVLGVVVDVPDRNSHLSSFGQCYSSNGSGLIAVSSGGRGRRVEPE